MELKAPKQLTLESLYTSSILCFNNYSDLQSGSGVLTRNDPNIDRDSPVHEKMGPLYLSIS